jgi:hypothetical protein
MTTDDQHDHLIFDFVEGNLTAEENEAFRILIEESELLDREVRLWQNVRLKEELLPSTDDLEKKLLLQRHLATGSNTATRIYCLLLILFVGLAPPSEKPAVDTYHQLLSAVVSDPDTIVPDSASNCEDVVAATESEVPVSIQESNTQGPKVTSDAPTSAIEEIPLTAKKLRPIIDAKKTDWRTIEIKKPIYNQPAPGIARKEWSGREKRLIRQRLRNVERMRQANEFQKGRVPYVVPLNNNNF